jgi:DNA polymerase-1
MAQREVLAIVDGHALAYRAYHALREAGLSTSGGEPTFAVFGFSSILLTTIQERRPAYLAVSFDVGKTFRHEQYAEYKATRRETPEDFEPQLRRIQQLIRALNIPIYTAAGYEADDVIGTLARQATAQGVDTLIVTGDTDTLQLVDAQVRVLLANPYQRGANTTLYDYERVLERYEGLRPDQLADLRGLKGDVSDNIPGVRGIGEKGAINLLKQFGSVESIYASLDQVPSRYRKALEGQEESARFSKQLAQIECEVPVVLDLSACALHDYDRDAVVKLFQELQFRPDMIKRLPSRRESEALSLPDTPTLPAAPALASTPAGPAQLSMFGEDVVAPEVQGVGSFTVVRDEAGLAALVGALTAAPGFAFDAETSSLDSLRAGLVGIALATRPGHGFYIPVGHHAGEQLGLKQVLDALRPFVSDPGKPKYAHNAKFDVEVLEAAGVPVAGVTFDSMLAAGLLGKAMGLKELAFFELGLQMTEIVELIGKGKSQMSMAEAPIERVAPYAAADADVTLRLVERLRAELDAEPRLADLFYKLEMPLLPVLVRMEQAGIGLDTGFLRELGSRMGEQQAQIQERIFGLAGRHFNIGSSQQLSAVLFDELKLPTEGLGKTKTGQYSLTAQTLEDMRDKHEIIELIIAYRQISKLKSTYVDALPELVDPQTGRVHTSFNQMGAATGRLSSTSPNLQNIPIRTEEGREIRRAFVAQPGHQFVAADYSQIELRVLAHITQDPGLIEVFQNEGDIHAATAAALYGKAPEQVTKNERRVAKTVTFGIIYGISSFGLAPRIGASRQEAQRLIDALFARYPGLREYIDATLQEGKARGYVQTLFGRRRRFAESAWKGPARQATEREAINAPIQGTSADLIKLAMTRLDEELRRHNLRSRLLLQVHDELLLEAPEHEVQAVAALTCKVMEQIYTLRVPLRVDVEAGPNWDEMQAVQVEYE